MLRCITDGNRSIIATTCDADSTRVLSRAQKLFCPNCKGVVQYNKGRVKSSYFSHVNLECEYIGSEPETHWHVKGKELLYGWLKTKFPTAYVEYEVHIPETGQIVDVYVKHNDGVFAGLVWAFEFQHSNISSTSWEERHELYSSAGIQDFWFFDKAKFMKFSKAKGAASARLRRDLEKTIFEEIGLCYFLDLETCELTIDFNFYTHTSYVDIGRGIRGEQSLTYHDPEKHAAHLDSMRVRMNQEYRYCVLLSDELEKYMEPRLCYIVEKLKKAKQDKIRQELNERVGELLMFAMDNYGDDFTERFREIIRESKAELRDDVSTLDKSDFFAKYKSIVETSISNLKEYDSLKQSTELVPRYLVKLANLREFNMAKFLREQGTCSLVEYLTAMYRNKIELVQYVFGKHKSVLEFLPTRRSDWVNKMLREINRELVSYATEPDVIDYAIKYGDLASTKDVDLYIQQVEDKIVNYKPTFDNFDDWD